LNKLILSLLLLSLAGSCTSKKKSSSPPEAQKNQETSDSQNNGTAGPQDERPAHDPDKATPDIKSNETPPPDTKDGNASNPNDTQVPTPTITGTPVVTPTVPPVPKDLSCSYQSPDLDIYYCIEATTADAGSFKSRCEGDAKRLTSIFQVDFAEALCPARLGNHNKDSSCEDGKSDKEWHYNRNLRCQGKMTKVEAQ
jgi:hypothetical protein